MRASFHSCTLFSPFSYYYFDDEELQFFSLTLSPGRAAALCATFDTVNHVHWFKRICIYRSNDKIFWFNANIMCIKYGQKVQPAYEWVSKCVWKIFPIKVSGARSLISIRSKCWYILSGKLKWTAEKIISVLVLAFLFIDFAYYLFLFRSWCC